MSGYRELDKGGLPGLLELIQSTVRGRRATLLVLDGASVVASMAKTPVELQKFTYELNTFLAETGCSGIVLSTGGRPIAEELMVESIILLDVRKSAMRVIRELRVAKLRGSEVLEGTHHYWIRSEGVSVYPRREALAARAAAAAATEQDFPIEHERRLPFGIPELDEMLEGGIPGATSTTILGAPGSGKTLLGCSFLAGGAEQGDRGLYFGFFEPPRRLLAKLDGIGLPFRRHVERGGISVMWQPPVERLLDSLADRFLSSVNQQKATRVVVDGVDGFRFVAADPERLPGFLIALSTELRSLGATTVFTEETGLFRPDVVFPLQAISATVDNIVYLRYVELRAQLRRLLSVLKIRDSGYDSSVREFRITERGFAVDPSSGSAELLTADVARQARGLAPEKARRRAAGRKGRR